MNSSDVQKLSDWLIDGARSAASPAHMFAEVCERLVLAGVPLWRVGGFIRTLHPDIYGRHFIWKPGAEVEIGTVDFKILDSPDFHTSPAVIVFQQGLEVRARADDPQSKRFPIIDDLRAEGVTDYVALPLQFIDGTINAIELDHEAAGRLHRRTGHALRAVMPAGAIHRDRQPAPDGGAPARYLCRQPRGGKILGGQIRRGHTESMHAAIWLSDLRGFTALSDRLPAENVVEILNQYFDCQVASIRAHGGEVLKYMGDGLLAVFPIDEYVGDARQVCSRVLEAAQESRASVADLHYPIGESVERFRFGVALHLGRILYGNIGGGNRLDFTCIGPAVNLAARLEKIASRLHRTIVASEGFAGICPAAGATSANSRSPAFQRRSASSDCSTNRRRRDAEMT